MAKKGAVSGQHKETGGKGQLVQSVAPAHKEERASECMQQLLACSVLETKCIKRSVQIKQ